MYKDILDEVPFLKVGNVAKAAGISPQMFNNLETKEYGLKKDAYRGVLKVLRDLVSICKGIVAGTEDYKDYPNYFKITGLDKLEPSHLTEMFTLGGRDIAKAYSDLLAKYKALKEEEDFQELEQEVKVNVFADETPVQVPLFTEEQIKPTPRVASGAARAAFMKTEAGFVRRTKA